MDTKFRKLRKETGMNMRQAADFFGTPYGTWRAWETGEVRTPNIALFAVDLAVQRGIKERDYTQRLKKQERERLI